VMQKALSRAFLADGTSFSLVATLGGREQLSPTNGTCKRTPALTISGRHQREEVVGRCAIESKRELPPPH